jgi:hypothetical protein
MGVLQSLYDNLMQSGINATIETEKKSALSQMNPFSGMKAQRMGGIALNDRGIAEIVLYGHWDKKSGASFGNTASKDRLEAVDVGYIVHGPLKGNKNDLEARLEVKRTGLVNRKVTEIGWEGGLLASQLSTDNSLTELLWQSIGQLSARDIKIKFDERDEKAEIYVSDDRQVISGQLPPLELYEKIAQHIFSLAGMGRTVSHEAPTSAGHTAAAMSSGIKYCFKCGEKMQEDSVFCPQCGIKQK